MLFGKILKNGFKNGTELLFQKQKTILSGASVIAVMVFLSAVLGLVRKRLYAGILGAGPEYDVLVAAFKIPDLIFQLLVAGSLNAAFIPLFSRYIVQEKSERAWGFASAVFNLTFLLFVFLAGVGFIFAPQLARLLAPGFTPDQHQQLIVLMRILIFSPLLLGLSSFAGGMVQSFRRFLLPFFSPVAYNLGAIFGILFLYSPFGLEGMAWGVLLGSFLHLIVILPLLRHLGFRYSFKAPWRGVAMRELVRLALPRTVWALVFQIKEFLLVNLASNLMTGSISVLDYGRAVVRFPIMIIGSSIGQASLPALTEFLARGEKEKFTKILINSFFQVAYLILPISVVLIILKIPTVRLTFGTGEFGWEETVLTSWIVALYAVSLFAQAGREVIVRAFYAMKDTDTPVLVGSAGLFLGLIFAALLIPYLKVRGLALGLSLGYVVEFLILFLLLSRVIKLDWKRFLIRFGKILFASAVMAVAIYFPVQILDEVFIDTTRVVNLLVLMWVVLTFGGAVYLFLTWFLGVKEVKIFFTMLLKIRGWREAIANARKVPWSAVSLDGEDIEGVE